jgi:hypothetical protein
LKKTNRLPPAFQELHDLAWDSAMLRIQRGLGMAPPSADRVSWWLDRSSNAFVALNDSIRDRMARLGRRCRNLGWDMRESAFWPSLEHKWAFVAAYEHMRPVTMSEMTPALLHEHLVIRNNIVSWNGWTIRVTARRLIDDDYGHPMLARGCKLYGPEGRRIVLDPSPDSPAQLVYALMTGKPAEDWPGEIGARPHPAEMCW